MSEEKDQGKSGFTENESSNQEGDDKAQSSETDNESSISSTTNSLTKLDLSTKPVEDEKREKKQGETGNCYCGKERNLNIVELLCANCTRWFHESCIGYQLGKLVPFLANYVFLCKNCSQTGLETFRKSQAQITQMCVTAIANLQQASAKEGSNKVLFNKEKEIIPYIEYHWEAITTTSRRVTQSWHSTVTKTLIKDIHVLFVFEDRGDGQMYGLVNTELTCIKPNYDAMIKGGTLKVTEMGIQHGNLLDADNPKMNQTAEDYFEADEVFMTYSLVTQIVANFDQNTIEVLSEKTYLLLLTPYWAG